jgi:hypothetical protein
MAVFFSVASPAFAQQQIKVNFSNETVGAEPKSFLSVVGTFGRIEQEGAKKVLAVDGRQWKEGQSSAGVADKARALYGDRYAEFLDRVQAYAYFPYAVAKDVQDFHNGEISVRFEGISGRIDQGAGILFNLKPNGDYLTVRANPFSEWVNKYWHQHPTRCGNHSERSNSRLKSRSAPRFEARVWEATSASQLRTLREH